MYRSMASDPVWENSTMEQKIVLMTILFSVNWDARQWDVDGKKITLNPGQMFISTRKLAQKCGSGVTHQNIRTALERFTNMGFLTQRSTHKGILISVVNWGKYQCKEINLTQEVTQAQHNGNTSLTQAQHKGNTTIKEEGKKLRSKEGKKVITTSTYMCFKPPELEEVQKYIEEKGYSFSPEAFVAYYDSKGWMIGKSKMKSWKSACVTWQLRQQNNRPSRGISSKDEWEGVTGL